MMNWLRRLATNRMLDVGAVAFIVFVLVRWSVILPPRWSDFDFNHLYVGGRMLLEGQNPYTTSIEALSHAMGFRFVTELPIATYPPPFLWIFAALAALSPRAAFAVWTALELVCLAVILWLTRRLLGERLSSRGWLFVAALTITSRAATYHLLFSQTQLLLAALVLAAYTAHRAGRYGWACLAVSVAGILKFYPFVLLPWFLWSSGGGARGRCRRLIGVTGFILAAIALTGSGLWRDFLRYGIPIGFRDEVGRTCHFSLPALVINLGYLHYNLRPSAEAGQWWWFIGTLAGVGVLAAGYAVCVASRPDPEAQFCLLCTAMLIGSVMVQGHYFVFLVFPLAVMAVRIATKPTLGHIVCLILLVLAFNSLDPPKSLFLQHHLVLYLLASDLPLYGLFGLGAFFWRELRTQS
jgi:hypothetical protein